MQAEYNILPKRTQNSGSQLANFKKSVYHTNFYEIQLNAQGNKVYLYDIKLEEDIPLDSILYHKAVVAMKDQLKEQIGYLAHKGQAIWGKLSCEKVLEITCQIDVQGEARILTALITKRKDLCFNDLKSSEYRGPVLNMLNVQLKQCLRDSKMHELGKAGKYFDLSNQINLNDDGLTILQGFQFTLVPLDIGIALRIDVCSRILQKQSLLDYVMSSNGKKTFDSIVGQSVITKYGNFKIHKIQEVDHTKSPMSYFTHVKTGKEETFYDYYSRKYNLKISNLKQPLLKVISEIKKVKEDGKVFKEVQYIYLLPELVSMTGITPEQINNFSLKKSYEEFTKLTPNQRIKKSEKIIEKLNKNPQSFIKIKKGLVLEGHQLKNPVIAFEKEIKPQNGIIKHRGYLKDECNFGEEWFVVFPANEKKNVIDAVHCIQKAGQTYGIYFDEPKYCEVKSPNLDCWIESIRNYKQKYGMPKIILAYLNKKQEQDMYGQLKVFLINQLQCPSQMVKKRTITNSKNPLSVASKICIQMAVKASYTPWSVKIEHPYFQKKNVMYGGISISHGSNGYTIGFTGTINNECTQVFSASKTKIKKKQKINVQILEQIFIEWAKNYFQNNKRTVPNHIILYRQSLSDSQAREQLSQVEIPALERMIKKMEKATSTAGYNPSITIVLVNKETNTRIFEANNKSGILQNPISGSVVSDKLTVDNAYEFYLVPHFVTAGTCTPTHYKIAYDTSKLSKDGLIEFTYNQCYNYYNWSGAVRVPGCLQCANKVSMLVGEHMKEDIKKSSLTNKPFFY